MVAKNTSQPSPRPFWKRRGYAKNSLAGTQQNSVAERKNHTILEMAYVMLQEKNMPKIYLAEAAEGVHDITPHEKYFGRKPNLSHLKVFGSICARTQWEVEKAGSKVREDDPSPLLPWAKVL